MANPSGRTTAAVKLRAGAGTDQPMLAFLQPKTVVEVLGTQGEWMRVKIDGKEGFVNAGFVVLQDQKVDPGFIGSDAPPPTPAPTPAGTPAPVTPEIPIDDVKMEPDNDDLIPLTNRNNNVERIVGNTWNKFGGLLVFLSNKLKIDPAVSVAVLATESGGKGFGSDGRMIIRFENQIFYDKWGAKNRGKYEQHYQFEAAKRWQGHLFRPATNLAWREFHGTQPGEWEAFEFARSLDDTAAKYSISMGGPQIMGFNYAGLGYESVQQMFDAFSSSERAQVIGFFNFVQGPGTESRRIIALQAKDFEAFAAQYNGPGQAAKYGSIIRSLHDVFHKLRPGT